MIVPHEYDVRRVQHGLFKEANKCGISQEQTRFAADTFPKIIKNCGHFSYNRRMARKIGKVLMQPDRCIMTPLCLNYSDLKDSVVCVKNLMEKHITFLMHIVALVPGIVPTFLIPDLEVFNPDVLRLSRINEETFAVILNDVAAMVETRVAEIGWESRCMSIAFADMREQEVATTAWLLNEKSLRPKLLVQANQRRSMYQKISHTMSDADMILRTAQTAAQYIVLGQCAARMHALICNHSTTSLRWYKLTEAGILHNPVTLL